VSTQVMFVNFDYVQASRSLEWIGHLRKAGISTELYPDDAKFKKQMNYADAKKIAYVVFAGEVELNKGVVKIRNMASGVENEIALNKMVEYFSKILKTK
ncbi:MAG: histidine--tRNA ligase, partial [Bacteroidia bacterium]|nr:histidine--tRNA ligase [Bacteroidia bacterium]